MRDGFKVFDTDTHIRPSAESIAPYLGPIVRERIPDLEDHRVEIKIGMAGEVRQPPYRHWYRFGRGEGGGDLPPVPPRLPHRPSGHESNLGGGGRRGPGGHTPQRLIGLSGLP